MRSFAVALVFVSAGAALADVDLTVGNGVKVFGTLDPGSETETFRFVAPAGALLKVSAKGKRARGATSAPAPRIAIYDPGETRIGTSSVTSTATGATLTGFELHASGEHSVVVSSEGQIAGDYQLLVTWAVPKKLAFDGTVSTQPAKFTISLPAGAVATLTATAPKGSVVRPWVSQVESGEFSQGFVQPAPSLKHKATMAEAPFTGEYVVSVSDQGGQGGGIVHLAVGIKAPRPVKKTVVVGSAVLVKSGTALPVARGALIGRDGGEIDIGDAGTPIDGASVSVPAGALYSPVPVVIGTAGPIPDAEHISAAGPTIFFGPEGTTFARDVTITIPFDPALAGGDLAALTVLTRDKKGRVTVVPRPYVIDAGAATVSFPSSHFSSYRAFGPVRIAPADLDCDGIDDLVVPAPYDASQRGAVFVFRGRKDVLPLSGVTTASADFVFTGVNATTGPTPGDVFGAAVATGDVNGDGTADLVVGATRADSGKGAVYVFFGGTGFASRSSAAADATLTAGPLDARFGATLVVAEATWDTVADIVVGAPYSSAGDAAAGGVYVFPGGTNFADATVADPGVKSVVALVPGGHFGISAAVGDVTGDGKPDLAVGADEQSSNGAGEVYVFADASSLGQGVQAGTGYVVAGDQFLGAFGSAVAIGDVDKDGTGDLVVGAPLTDIGSYPTLYDVGQVFVFGGGASFGSTTSESATKTITLPFARAGDYGGESLVLANLAGDGAPDLLVGARGASAAGKSQNGVIYQTRGGPPFGNDYQVDWGNETSDGLGLVLPPADVNGDGWLDAIVATPVADGYAGRVRVYLGPGLGAARFEILGAGVQHLGARDVGVGLP